MIMLHYILLHCIIFNQFKITYVSRHLVTFGLGLNLTFGHLSPRLPRSPWFKGDLGGLTGATNRSFLCRRIEPTSKA